MKIGFNGSERSTLGVEVELQIVDRETWGLSSGASAILAAVGNEIPGGHLRVKHELMESNLELVTGVCETVAEARADLEATLGDVTPAATDLGLAFCCAGTHPFSDWAEQRITGDERYERLIEQMAWPARRLNIFGIHCHVGVRSAEKAIAIANALRPTSPISWPCPPPAPTGWARTRGWRPSVRRCSRRCPPPGSPSRWRTGRSSRRS